MTAVSRHRPIAAGPRSSPPRRRRRCCPTSCARSGPSCAASARPTGPCWSPPSPTDRPVGAHLRRLRQPATPHERRRTGSTSTRRTFSLTGVFLAQLAIAVLGVLVITSEYSTGMIRSTFAAVPQRRTVLAAKATVFGAVTLVVGLVSCFVAFFVGQAILSSKDIQAHIGDPGVLRAVVGAGLYLGRARAAGPRHRHPHPPQRRRHRGGVRPDPRRSRCWSAPSRRRGPTPSRPYLPSNAGEAIFRR